MSCTTVGILLQAIPYLGQKKILKVFTPEEGLLSFFAQSTKLDPFCIAEWVYRKKSQKEMYPLLDASLIDPLLHLRSDYATLSAAGQMAKDLLQTQLPHKKAPELFKLVVLYLQRLSDAPATLLASFRLKLLHHEGLLSHEQEEGFTEAEWEQAQVLAFSRKLSEIQAAEPPHAKIERLLKERMECGF